MRFSGGNSTPIRGSSRTRRFRMPKAAPSPRSNAISPPTLVGFPTKSPSRRIRRVPLRSRITGCAFRPDQEVLTAEHDHYVHHESIRYAAARSGCGVRYVALYDGPAEARAGDMTERLACAIGPKTRAVGITWVHSSTGVKLPLHAMADAVARANRGRTDGDRRLLIVDGVHGFGNQDVDIAALGCDFFAAGAHKWLFAPRGTGFLWGRRETWPALRPTIPTFDPDAPQPWDAWMNRTPLPPTEGLVRLAGRFRRLQASLHRSRSGSAASRHRPCAHCRAHSGAQRSVPTRGIDDSWRQGAHAARFGARGRDFVFRDHRFVGTRSRGSARAEEDPDEQLALQGIVCARRRRDHEHARRYCDGAARDSQCCCHVTPWHGRAKPGNLPSSHERAHPSGEFRSGCRKAVRCRHPGRVSRACAFAVASRPHPTASD